MGDPADDANESGSSEWETTPKTSDVSEGSQRGHSTRRAGKPRTWGRATAYQVPQVRSCPCIPGNPGWAAERKEGKDPDRRSPCAVKAARTVTTGGMGRHSSAVHPVPTHSCWPEYGSCGSRTCARGIPSSPKPRKSPESNALLLMWQRNRSMFVHGISTPSSYGG
jgi:hypothetical protein